MEYSVPDFMLITKIERQKKNRNRFSIFIDDAYAFSIGEEIYARFLLHEDQNISEEERSSIESAEAESTVKKTALRFRSYRPRSTQEITQYLRRKGYDDKFITIGIRYLNDNKLLNDEEFARMVCRDRIMLKPVGQNVMRQVLYKKGIAKDVVDSVLAEYYSTDAENDLALKEAEKRHQRLKTLPHLVQKKKLYEHLIRRGYSSSISMNIVNQLIRQ